MSENFCLQPYHIGERLLACFLNMSTDIVKEKFNISLTREIEYLGELNENTGGLSYT